MEFQQFLIKLERLERGRIGVGDVLADVPRQKLLRRRENGTVGGHFKSVLRFGGGLFARGVESQRFLPDEVVEGRTIGIRERTFLQQAVEGGDGGGLEAVRAGEGGLKLAVDLGEQPSQVPRGEVFARGLRGRGPLHETPAVVLKIMPVPIRQDRVQQRRDFLRRLGDLRLQAGDFLLRFVALNIPFEHDFSGDGLGGFAPSPVLERALDDRFKRLDGGLGQTFVDGLVHFLPLGVPAGGAKRITHSHDQR